jgi:hypothetical protein
METSSVVPQTEPETTPLLQANGDCGANFSSPSSSLSEPKEETQSKLGTDGASQARRGTSAAPPEATGGTDKYLSPSTNTKGSQSSPSKGQ